MLSPALSRAAFASVAMLFAAPLAQAEKPVSFNKDIRPIMSDTCFHCHGFDAKKREAKLRLDIREEALKEAESGALPIVPGKPDESEIIRRIFTSDKDDLMPPPKAHKELTQAQKETIKRWVAEGAKYEAHWAYAPLVKPAVPANGAANPIDAFIREKLAEKKIQPSPEAAPAKLLRRVSLDLTGLPPTPEETNAFTPSAMETSVDRLLASPRFGERMAVWWLDIARFADTVGFHGDQNQRIFPYRDYVINAFNTNKRFDQFTIEQLAGDLLPDPTTEQLVATGYNRLNMMTREGGAQPREYLAKYGAERVRSVAAAWFGSTFGCAECHDHKFDPIKTADFYSLQAFFADMKQWGYYADARYARNTELEGFGNEHPFPPEVEVESPYLAARKKRAETELNAHLRATRERLSKDAKATENLNRWIEETRAFLTENPRGWATPPVSAQICKDGKPQPDADVPIGTGLAVQMKKALGKGEDVRVNLQPGTARVAAVRVELVKSKGLEAALAGASAKEALKLTAAVKPASGKEHNVGIYFADATGKIPRFGDGAETLGVVGGWKLPKKAGDKLPAAVWLLDPPVQLSEGDKLALTISGEVLVPFRVSVSPFAAVDPLRVAGKPVRDALLAAPEARTARQRDLLADAWIVGAAPDRPAFDTFKKLAAKVRSCTNGRTWSMVTQSVPDPLTIRVLPRGNWQDESGPVVLPATPSFLPGRLESREDKRLTRLDLAKWICSADNPITARAVMNRLWQPFFGTGLSAALDDLGSQGEPPSHPELLDWLACEFRDSGWDIRHMIRLIVTSETYRQSSSLRPELRDADPANRLLASQNPRRLEAEFVRDNALFIAGALNLRDVGGPSVKPYQPAGYYESLQFPNRDYVSDTTDEQWRRGVYMHWQRTFLHPMLANFDAPARDECAATRVVSNTPQQALTLLNDPTFVEAARLFAGRLLSLKAANDDECLDRLFQLADARPAKEKEKASLKQFLAGQRDYYRANAGDAAKLLKIGLKPEPTGDPTELAAWTSVCRIVLNSQETITRY